MSVNGVGRGPSVRHGYTKPAGYTDTGTMDTDTGFCTHHYTLTLIRNTRTLTAGLSLKYHVRFLFFFHFSFLFICLFVS